MAELLGNKIKRPLRPCPICFAASVEVLHTQKFILPSNSPLPPEYDLVCCTVCGFVYADTPVTQADYDRYYRELSKYEDKNTASGTGEDLFDKDRLTATARNIVRLFPNKSVSIVDIGCGNGGLLLTLKQNGYQNIKGLDPSAVCVNNIKNNGIDAVVGGLFNPKQNELFDLIILTHVFEHVRDLKLALINLSAMLRPAGKLYLEVPDALRYNKFYKVPYYYFDTEHINHFCVASLLNLLRENNFELISYGEKEFLFARDKLYPAVYVVGGKAGVIKRDLIKDTAVRSSIMDYLRMSERDQGKIYGEQLNMLKNNQEGIAVWGAGNHTMRLLASSNLGKCNIKMFIDKDSKKQGQKLNGIIIEPPTALKNFKETIVICSAIFSAEIIKEIKEMSLDNNLVVCN